jgi:glycerol-1-phosphatase
VGTTAAARQPGLRGCPRPLSEEYDTALLDLDGVVYMAGEPVAEAPRHLADAVAAGTTAAFVTNNASRPPGRVAERLRRMGVDCADEDVVTSAQAAARLVAARVPAGARVLVVGGDGLLAALEEHGLVGVDRLEDDPAAVVQGFGPEVGWRLLAEASAAVHAGLPWIASNPDLTVPTPRGPAPGNGALVQVVALATGKRPEVAGKPQSPLFEETMLRVGGRRPLVVGDRLDTDIEGAVRFGADSLLVMTGVTDVVTLAAAAPPRRPTYLAPDLAGLLAPHPQPEKAPEKAGEEWRCGGWTARAVADDSGSRSGSWPELHGAGAPADALRALVSLCWAHADGAGSTGAAESAERGDGPWPDDLVDTAWRAASTPDQPLPWVR